MTILVKRTKNLYLGFNSLQYIFRHHNKFKFECLWLKPHRSPQDLQVFFVLAGHTVDDCQEKNVPLWFGMTDRSIFTIIYCDYTCKEPKICI